jgi:L-2,4-diaminobutyrate decarboxylase
LLGDAWPRFLDDYLGATTRLRHPAYMAHQVSVPHPAGAIASLVDGFTNNAMAIYEMGPAATAIEFAVINWMLEKAGWVPAPWPGTAAGDGRHGAGVLTHGGSLATLTALVAARRRAVPDIWVRGNPPRLAVLASEHAHYAIARAAGIMGLGRDAVIELDTDDNGSILPDRIPAVFERAVADGYRPFALVANCCSTPVGRYDPLREIAQFCREQSLWLHADGAHGASALVSPRLRHLLDGIELADSLVWDAHKLLRAPTLCAAVLVRNAPDLDTAFVQEGSYIFHDKVQPGIDMLGRTVECTKAGLGLKAFFVLATLGERGVADYVERVTELAHRACELIRARPGFSCPVEPQSNIVCFRHGDSDATQMALRNQLTVEGDFYISTTEFRGRRYLRLALMNPDTTPATIEALLARIESLAAEAACSPRQTTA